MHQDNDRYTRRDFLQQSSATAVGALLSTGCAFAARQISSKDSAPLDPRSPASDTGMKFFPDGRRRPFAGNTGICHLPQQCVFRDAVTTLGDELRSSSIAYKLGILPAESYHMTIFPGANDQGRSTWGWPSDIPMDASISECNRIIGERMAHFRLMCEVPLRVRLDIQRTLEGVRASTLRMSPADEAENKKLRTLRDRLAEAYRFRAKDHDSYGFHITVSYQMRPFTPEEQSIYNNILRKHVTKISAAAPVLELGLLTYCTFEDMYRFEIRKLLNS